MSSLKITVPVPKIEDRELKKPMLCGPGPKDLWPSITMALTTPIVSPSCDEYYNIWSSVTSRYGVPFLIDEWGVDVVFASSQKALSSPVGIRPVIFHARAVYHHTMCPPMMWALRRCLQEICNRTLPVCWELHKTTTAYFHKRLEESDFKLIVPKVDDRLPTVTTVELPKGYDYSEFCKYIRDFHNILIFPGLGPTVGKALRIGIMRVNCSKNVADVIVDAMVDATIESILENG